MNSETTNIAGHCPHCGAELRPGAKFCPACGASLAAKVGESSGSESLQPQAREKSKTGLLTALLASLAFLLIIAFFLMSGENTAGLVQSSVFIGPPLNSHGDIIKTPDILVKSSDPGELQWNDAATKQAKEKESVEIEPAQLNPELSSESKQGYSGEDPAGSIQSATIAGQLGGNDGATNTPAESDPAIGATPATDNKPGLVVSPGQTMSATPSDSQGSAAVKAPEKKKAKSTKGKQPTSSEMPFRTAIAYEPNFSVNARSSSQVKNAIIKALKGRGWVPSIKSSKHIRATLHIRSHTVVADIYYNTKTVSIYHRSSKNLKYQKIRGWKIIHKNYNNWVENLQHDILAYVK